MLNQIWQFIKDRTGFFEYRDSDGKRQRGKTLWDWMQLLIIPFILLALGRWYSNASHESDLAVAEERFQEERLNTFLVKMEDYVLNKGLLEAKDQGNSSIFHMAQVQSVTALRTMDTERQTLAIQFLFEMGLSDIFVNANMENIDLNGVHLLLSFRNAKLGKADLSDTWQVGKDLSGIYLWKANLMKADWQEVNLSGAYMFGANLSRARIIDSNLSNVDFTDAILYYADLSGSDLSGAKFYLANLKGADLSETCLAEAAITEKQLASAKSLEGAIMPDEDYSKCKK